MSFYRSYFRLNVNSHMWLVPTILDKTILDCYRNRVKGPYQALCCSTRTLSSMMTQMPQSQESSEVNPV